MSYPWPGNVSELINALERALVNGRYERILFPKHLPTHIRTQIARSSVSGKETTEIMITPSSKIFPKIQELREKAVNEVEEKYLKDLLSFTKGDIKEACQISGLSRSRLYLLLKKYNISTSS